MHKYLYVHAGASHILWILHPWKTEHCLAVHAAISLQIYLLSLHNFFEDIAMQTIAHPFLVFLGFSSITTPQVERKQ